MKSIAVVVPTRNRPDKLRQCLASIRDGNGDQARIVVVDQDAEGSAAAVCAEFEGSNVRYLSHLPNGKSAALNAGIGATAGEFVAFTDDDCTVPVGWLASGAASLRADPTLGIVFGGAIACPHDRTSQFVPSFVPRNRDVRRGRLATGKIGALGGNMFCRRELLEELGGFDEMLGPGMAISSAEDQDLNNRALRAGYRVLCDPTLLVTHWGARPYSNEEVTRLMRGYSVGIGALAMKDIRCGSLAGAYPLIREVGAEVRSGAMRAVGQGPGRFTLRSPWLAKGLWKGLRLGIDPAHEKFIAAVTKRP